MNKLYLNTVNPKNVLVELTKFMRRGEAKQKRLRRINRERTEKRKKRQQNVVNIKQTQV